MTINIALGNNGYDVDIQRGALMSVADFFDLDRRAFIITDNGVPSEYADTVAAQCKMAHIETIAPGESNKCFAALKQVLNKMIECGISRKDCVIAVGGGMVGDLAGFAASVYMRGIEFYNIPTTVLSQVDSSVGGKTAIDFDGIKNIVGSFYQPKHVLIDPNTLSTLPARQISNGLAEALKMSLTSDPNLYRLFETNDPYGCIDEVIIRAIRVKANVIEQDEKETNLRRVLNFGHTIGHAIESVEGFNSLLHGECVALGMLAMSSEKIKPELKRVLNKMNLPTTYNADADRLIEIIKHDKKAEGSMVTVTMVDFPGSYTIKTISLEELKKIIKNTYETEEKREQRQEY